MKRTQLIAAVIAIIFAGVLLWRQSALEAELAALRSAMGNRAAPSHAAGSALAGEPRRTSAQPSPPPGHSSEDQARIADLERVANAHADIIEELLKKFGEMEFARQKSLAPSWSVLQVIGPPDTMSDGDHSTAWAPAQQDGGVEWLTMEYAQPVEVAQVVVRETCGPGCITKITTVTDAGTEVALWEGSPQKNASPSNTVFNIPPGTTTSRVKVYLDTRLIAGWNEIDAVQLVGRDGTRQWARNASASSSYGGGNTLNLGGDGKSEGTLRRYDDGAVDVFWLSGRAEKTSLIAK